MTIKDVKVIGYRPYEFTSTRTGDVVSMVEVFGVYESKDTAGVRPMKANCSYKKFNELAIAVDSVISVAYADKKWHVISV